MRALVTGSTSGIGAGIARALAAAGYEIVLHGLAHPDAVAALQEELGAAWDPADLNDPEAIGRMVSAAGDLDVLVNNAGIQHTDPIEEFPVEQWDRILAVNLSAAFHTIRLTLPGMRRRGFGRIINVASVHGLVASRNKAAYVAAKHALVGLTKVVALETAGSGVTCNAVCPGWVLTPLVEAQIEERARRDGVARSVAEHELLAEKQPSGQFVTTEQLGALVLFLCSPSAASITGASLPVDGGWTAQ